MHDLQGDPGKYQTYLATRPKSFEANAVALLIDVLRKSKDQVMKPGFWLHIVHLANADLLQDIKQAQDEGQSLLSMSSSYCCPSTPQLLFAPNQSQWLLLLLLLLLLLTNYSQHASRQMVFQLDSLSPFLLLLLLLITASEMLGQAPCHPCSCIAPASCTESALASLVKLMTLTSPYPLTSCTVQAQTYYHMLAPLQLYLVLNNGFCCVSKSSCCCSCRPASQRGNCSPLHWLQ